MHVPAMHVPERAAQIWPLLAWAAHNRQTLTYEIVGSLIGVPRQGVGEFLGPIKQYCNQNRLPPLNLLVTSELTGLPSSGCDVAPADVPRVQTDIFKHDWLATHSPSPVELEHAITSQMAAGIPSPS